VHVFPNPMEQSATFKLSETISGNIQLNIYDITGRLVDSRKYDTPSFVWQRDNLMAGMYSYEIINHAAVIAVGKLMVQ